MTRSANYKFWHDEDITEAWQEDRDDRDEDSCMGSFLISVSKNDNGDGSPPYWTHKAEFRRFVVTDWNGVEVARLPMAFPPKTIARIEAIVSEKLDEENG